MVDPALSCFIVYTTVTKEIYYYSTEIHAGRKTEVPNAKIGKEVFDQDLMGS